MYVHDLNCSWMKHPFATNRFEVKTEKQIRDIQKLGIQELYIDTDMDIVPNEPGTSKGPETRAVSQEPMVSESENIPTSGCNLEEEMGRSAKIKWEMLKKIEESMGKVRLGQQIELEQFNPVVERMIESITRNKDALLGLTRIRRLDKYTFEHSVSVSVLLTAFGLHLNFPQEEVMQIGIGGLLFDIGKVKIPQNILLKRNKLTEQEFVIIKKHVVYSRELLEAMPGISDIALSIADEHHERMDGSGYPDGKVGDDISFFGQMAAIVDAYDALTTDRVYCDGMSPTQALQNLIGWGESLFNQELVHKFIHFIGIYPIGSLVSLSDGHFAVIIESGDEPLLPKIRVIFNSITRQFVTSMDIELSNQQAGNDLKIVGAVDPAKWRIDPSDFLPHRAY